MVLKQTRRLILRLVIIAVFGALLIGQLLATAAFASNHVQSDSLDVSGLVPAPPPTQAASITRPTNSERFNSAHITVSGTCQPGMIIEIHKNSIFAGSTDCKDNGTFELEIDLVEGKNRLIAKTRDNLNQYGPNSDTVTVFYDIDDDDGGTSGPGVSNPPGSFNQLVILIDAIYQGQGIGQALNIDLRVEGGKSPYALTVDWGDGAQDLISQAGSRKFTVSHKYEYAGTYKVIVKSTDALGNIAYLEAVAVVSGQTYQSESTKPIDESFDRFINDTLMVILMFLSISVSILIGKKWAYTELRKSNKD